MTSLLDQYEQRSATLYQSGSTMLGEEEKPMFKKWLVSEKTELPDEIHHMAVSDDTVVILLDNGRLRWYYRYPCDLSHEVELNRIVPGMSAQGLYLDPSGHHLLIAFPTELLYQRRQYKPKPVSKLKNVEVSAVGWWRWDPATPTFMDNSTSRPLLLGTKRGQIFEAELTSSSSSTPDIYCRQVFNIGKESYPEVTGLWYYCVDPRGDSTGYVIIATTINRLYHFTGMNRGPLDRPLLQPIFNRYLNLTNESFQEIPNRLKYSKLHMYPSAYSSGVPDSLGWLTETGIFYCQIDPYNQSSIFTNTRMLNLPEGPAPLDFILTEFHVLLFYPDNVTGICILNQQTVFIDYYNEMYGRLVGMTKDPKKGYIWLFAKRAIYRYVITKEDKNIWQIYLDKKNYEMAVKYCINYPEHLDQVYMKQADHLFQQNKYEESAGVFAQTNSSFEDIALKFLEEKQINSLKIFLRKKFMKLKKGEKAQVTILLLWILEMMLSELALLRVQSKNNTSEYEKLQEELELFLSHPDVQSCTRSNKNSVYDLMCRHGDQHNLTKFALINNDYERVINDNLYKEDYLQALSILKQHGRHADLWYQFAPILVQCKAKETLQAIRELEKPLNPAKLLPALITAHSNKSSEVLKYLEYCVNHLNCQEQAVHNLLLSLYAQERPERLKQYLAIQGLEASMVNYDIGYALRVCHQNERWEACVQLSAMLGLWDNSVEQALKINLQLAKEKAAQVNDRKLYLKIAEHIITKEKNTAEALAFLQQCDCIKIEDILPYFPDSTTIDNFKDAICSALQEYNQHIQDLNEEMDEATKSAEAIRCEINNFRSKYIMVDKSDKCSSCNELLLVKPLKPVYVFPCSHKFHSGCLFEELTPLLTLQEQDQLYRLQQVRPQTDRTRADLDSLAASQCLYCGDRFLQLIKKPLIPEEEYERIVDEWK